MWLLLLNISPLLALRCPKSNPAPLQFHLVRQCQRAATTDALALESTGTLEECMALARELRGLALNFAPGGPGRRKNYFETQPRDSTSRRRQKDARNRLSVFEQPAEYFNCHVLACPQNTSFAGMTNDSRFDYYSLYGRPTALHNISCIEQVGLFVFYTQPANYLNASTSCSNASEFSGSLAHVASEARTYGLSQWLVNYNRQRVGEKPEPGIFLAYVDLQFNISKSLQPLDYRNAQQESLLCFLYRAWHVGHPRIGGSQANASCVALTPNSTWQTLCCDRELPFICEIFTPPKDNTTRQLDTGANAADGCY
ncbi:uncharacterized protein LOC6579353 [Drosophila mojavensis]|uniref:C-type lectin domain-containing protein n=1 Tax=Drosophila mojavensis TaxID=7230 RepID=B4KQ56_DROMO|nr:uncharacterized protein LOC6579353 [Drosophila mojavensis]EDW09184.1 uncharacterized protein Dmoj_GI19188 [Drosophila mojavensis]